MKAPGGQANSNPSPAKRVPDSENDNDVLNQYFTDFVPDGRAVIAMSKPAGGGNSCRAVYPALTMMAAYRGRDG
jgi:hypothetical protein